MQKGPKRSQNVQKCFEHVLGYFFRKFLFCNVFHGGSSLRNVFKKSKKFQNSKSAQNRSQKGPNMLSTCFSEFFSKTFLPSLPWRVESSKCFKKKFQKYKNAQNRSQKCPNVFWTCFGVLSSEISFCPVYHGGWSLRNAFKNQKSFKIPKTPKNVPKVSKSVLNMFWGTFSEISFCPVFHGGWSLRNAFKKSKKFQNSKNARKRSQSVQKCFEHVLGYFSPKFFLPSVPRRVESSKCF